MSRVLAIVFSAVALQYGVLGATSTTAGVKLRARPVGTTAVVKGVHVLQRTAVWGVKLYPQTFPVHLARNHRAADTIQFVVPAQDLFVVPARNFLGTNKSFAADRAARRHFTTRPREATFAKIAPEVYFATDFVFAVFSTLRSFAGATRVGYKRWVGAPVVHLVAIGTRATDVKIGSNGSEWPVVAEDLRANALVLSAPRETAGPLSHRVVQGWAGRHV